MGVSSGEDHDITLAASILRTELHQRCITRCPSDDGIDGRSHLDILGVINVREIMSGKGDLRITVVGTDADNLTRIAQGIISLGIEIDDEDLVHREYFRPYAPFGPRDKEVTSPVTGVAGLAGDADVVEVIVRGRAPIAGKTLLEANEEKLIPSDVLVVRINRDEGTITPTGETLMKENDFVTIHSRLGVTEETLEAFTGD